MRFIEFVYIRIFPLTVLIIFSMSGIFTIAGCAGQAAIKSPAAMVRVDSDKGNGQIKLAWDNASGDVFYYLYVSKTAGAKEFGDRFVNVANPVTITNLEVGTTYHFVVTSVRSGNESEPSEEISVLVE